MLKLYLFCNDNIQQVIQLALIMLMLAPMSVFVWEET